MNIECAKYEYAEEISNLMIELGYETTRELTEIKLQFISNSELDEVFVAIEDNRIVGVISCHLTTLFHVLGMCGRITSLVVNKNVRGSGIGQALVEKADCYFKENNCIKAEVTSGEHRNGAHQFYVNQGYVEDQRRFIKLYN